MTTTLSIVALTVASTLAIACTTPRHLRPRAIALFVLHLAIGTAIYRSAGLWAPDAVVYDTQARALAHYWNGDFTSPPRVSLGKEGWPMLLAFMYRYLAPHAGLGLVVNACFSALCLPLVNGISRELGGSEERSARITWLLFLPPFLAWGSLLLREAGMWCFILAGIYGLLRIARKQIDLPTLLIVAFGLLGASAFRASAAIIVFATALAVLVFSSRAPIIIKLITSGAVAGFAPWVLRFAESAAFTDIQALNRSQSSLATADSGFSSGSLNNLPLGLARALVGPFPWEWLSLSPIYLVSWLCWIPVLVGCLRRVRWSHSHGLLIWPVAANLVALAFTSGNYGTMIRLRDTAMIMLLPLLAQATRADSPQASEGVSLGGGTTGNAGHDEGERSGSWS